MTQRREGHAAGSGEANGFYFVNNEKLFEAFEPKNGILFTL